MTENIMTQQMSKLDTVMYVEWRCPNVGRWRKSAFENESVTVGQSFTVDLNDSVARQNSRYNRRGDLRKAFDGIS